MATPSGRPRPAPFPAARACHATACSGSRSPAAGETTPPCRFGPSRGRTAHRSNGAAGVAGPDILIVGVDAGDIAIELDALHPVLFAAASAAGSGLFAEIGGDVAAVAAGVQRREDGLAVGAFPDSNVERDTHGRLLGGIGATDFGRGLPTGRELLSGEALDAGVRQEAGERGREAEAIRQHIFSTGFAEFLAEIGVAVQHLDRKRVV